MFYRVTITHPSPTSPDVEVEIELEFCFEELQGVMRQVIDGHVMEQPVIEQRQYGFIVGEQFLGRFDGPDVFAAFFRLCEQMAEKGLTPKEWQEFTTGKRRLEAMKLGVGLYWSMFRSGWIAELKNRYSNLEAQAVRMLGP
jgi:hypothetical protein